MAHQAAPSAPYGTLWLVDDSQTSFSGALGTVKQGYRDKRYGRAPAAGTLALLVTATLRLTI